MRNLLPIRHMTISINKTVIFPDVKFIVYMKYRIVIKVDVGALQPDEAPKNFAL